MWFLRSFGTNTAGRFAFEARPCKARRNRGFVILAAEQGRTQRLNNESDVKACLAEAVVCLLMFAPCQAARLIGPLAEPTQAKAEAWNSVHEPAADEDFIYEDGRIILWFDFSSGGTLRGIWLKDHCGKVMRSANSLGEQVPTNLLFGGGHQLIAGGISKPDSPSENFMVFGDRAPRPGLPGRQYVREGSGWTEVGFIAWLYNQQIKTRPGFDPNIDAVRPEDWEPNIYINESWPSGEERWIHVSTDEQTRRFHFVKKQGDGAMRRIAYRARYRIYHNQMRYDLALDVMLYNRPQLCALLVCMDTLHEQNPNASDYVKSLGVTGLNTATWDAVRYEEWLGIPPAKPNRIVPGAGKLPLMRHNQQPGYPGNGATSFVAFKPHLRQPWIQLINPAPKVSGLDVVVKREFTNFGNGSHIGFTATPWFENSRIANWWITTEAALITGGLTKDLEVRSIAETVSFRTGNNAR